MDNSITLSFSEAAREEIEELKISLHIKDNADLFCRALLLFLWYEECTLNGMKIHAMDESVNMMLCPSLEAKKAN